MSTDVMEEMVYFCPTCGKASPTKTGKGGDRGWDVSCYMNAIQIPHKVLGDQKQVQRSCPAITSQIY